MPKKGQDFAQGYVPQRGHILHFDWAPAIGHEMKGPHYGLALSQDTYNIATGFVIVAPITSKIGKLSAFEFPIKAGRVNGVVLLSEIRALDYQSRRLQYEDRILDSEIDEACRRIKMIF